MATATRRKQEPVPQNGRPPGTFEPESRTSRLCMLEIGECESISRRMTLQEATREEVINAKRQLNHNLYSCTKRASARTGYTFQIETVDARTNSDAVIVTAVATRTD